MKYIRGKKLVSTSNNESDFPQCSLCKEKNVYLAYTDDNKFICISCMSKDNEFEWRL
jgi:hypothetical protein